ncbi:MAG: Mur ligase family protein [bacterium]|nr:Mur ligase family protein [bacterium]
MKKVLKTIIVAVLARQVRQLRKKNSFKIIGVVGGIGKTSTKMAIAHTLSAANTRVRWQEGNYNDIVSVPLVLFGQDMPSLLNPFAWTKVIITNTLQLFKKYPYDVVVLELGTDGPGQIAAFKKYLQLDIAVVTSVVSEHMEYFDDLQAVAVEELSVSTFSNLVVYNADFVAPEFRNLLPGASIAYGMHDTSAKYRVSNVFQSAGALEADVKFGEEILLHITQELVSEVQLYSVLAAVIIGHQLQIKPIDIKHGLMGIRPVSGRLRRLRGINNSIIIDDTYNASPEAMKAGLQALYKLQANQKIAILGNMNELGQISMLAHKEIGEMCDPSQLSLVVTIGPDANDYLAPAAEARGCKVRAFNNPYDAGEYVESKIESGAIIFAKGSQNKVFAEEAVKQILADPEDVNKLVRQSGYWLKHKKSIFKDRI